MHILLIEDDPAYRRLICQHLATGLDEALVVEHQPARLGRLPPEFNAVGYGVVRSESVV